MEDKFVLTFYLFVSADALELVGCRRGGSSPTIQKGVPHTTSVIAPRMQSQEKEKKHNAKSAKTKYDLLYHTTDS